MADRKVVVGWRMAVSIAGNPDSVEIESSLDSVVVDYRCS